MPLEVHPAGASCTVRRLPSVVLSTKQNAPDVPLAAASCPGGEESWAITDLTDRVKADPHDVLSDTVVPSERSPDALSFDQVVTGLGSPLSKDRSRKLRCHTRFAPAALLERRSGLALTFTLVLDLLPLVLKARCAFKPAFAELL